MRLRQRKSFITTLPEGRAPRSGGARITQILYLLAILGLLAYLVYLGVERFLWFEGRGQVEVEKTTLSSTRGGRILALPVSEGDQVRTGALLARLESDRECAAPDNPRLQRLLLDRSRNQARMRLLRQRLAAKTPQRRDDRLRRALELDPRFEREQRDLERELEGLRNDIAELESETALQAGWIEQMQMQDAARPPAAECLDEELRAPFDATVQVVRKRVQEVTARGEPLLVLVGDGAPVRIEAYLPGDLLGDVHVGQPFELEFPNGEAGRGIAQSVVSTAYRVPEREWDGYDPEQSRILTYLVPPNDVARDHWRRFDRMDVEVRARR